MYPNDMKYFLTTAVLLFFAYCLRGQQPAQYSMYMLNQLNWNPAYAGLDHSLSLTGVYRRQWNGLIESNSGDYVGPTSQYVGVHMPLYLASGGVGLQLENDQLGAERWTSVTLAYNYQLFLGSGILSFGIGGGLIQRSLDGSKLRTPDGNYEGNTIIEHNDNILPTGTVSAQVPSFNAGVYFQGEWLEAGLAVRHLVEEKADFTTFSLQLTRNYFFTLGLNFDVGNSFSIHPSAFVRSDFIQTQTDLSVRVRYNDNVFGGLGLRGYNSDNIDAVTFMAGFKLNENINFGYAYDLILSDLNVVSNGSHEIMLNYNLNKRIGAGRLPNIIYNPRF